MKKLVFASAMALQAFALFPRSDSRFELKPDHSDSGSGRVQQLSKRQHPERSAQKCAALESFLKAYPQSTAKAAAYDQMIDCYQQTNQPDALLSAASRLLQIDPNNMKAIYITVSVKKTLCGKALDPSGASTTRRPATMVRHGQKGLSVPKPADTSDADWKTMTANLYPVFHSAIAYDDLVSKKDYAAPSGSTRRVDAFCTR